METVRIQTGATERITAMALSSALAPLTGLTDMLIAIQRISDGFFFDWGDLTFKSVGWGTRLGVMTEISATLAAGQYYRDFITGTITNAAANDTYLITVTQTAGTAKNMPQVGELKVGQYADNLNATISSRSTLTQAQIISDSVPFLGARIDAAVSSRAAPGAAMDLVTDAVDANALAADAIAEINSGLSAIHGAGSWEGSTASVVAAAVWNEALPGAYGAGSAGKIIGDDLDAKVSSRAVAGDAMALTPAERTAIDTQLSGTHGLGSWEGATAVAIDAQLSGTHGAGNWEGGGGGPGVIAAAVWDELLAGHGIPGSSGLIVNSRLDAQVSTRATQAQIINDATPFPGASIDVAMSTRASAVAVSAVQADTNDIQARLPAALVGGKIDANVGTMNAGVITAAVIASDAIDADALAADAVVEIQLGLATSVALATVQADTDDIQTRLPATLVGGRMRSHVEAMDTDVIGAAQIAAGAIGAAEAPLLANLDVAVSTRAAPGDAMDLVNDALDSNSLATSAVAEIDNALSIAHGAGSWEGDTAIAIDAQLSGTHGAGSWVGGGSPAAVAAAVWNEALPGAYPANSAGERLSTVDGHIDVDTSTRSSVLDVTTVGANVINVQSRIPAALVGGRIDASVGAMGADVIGSAQIAAGAIGVSEAPLLVNLDVAVSTRAVPGDAMTLTAGSITAAVIATNAIDADAVAADAVAEIQAGLATAIAVAAVQADTDDLQLRLPATLVGGRMRSHVEAMDANVIGASQIAAGAIGTSEAPLLANLDAVVSSRSVPGDAMDLITDAVDANALAVSAISEIDAAFTLAHGAGNWTSGTPAAVAAAVWDEATSGHVTPGSFGKELQDKPSDFQIETTLASVHGAGAWGGPTAPVIADAVWDEGVAGHVAASSFGKELQDKPTDVEIDTELSAAHGAGSWEVTSTAIAGAVWDVAKLGHSIPGSFGEEEQSHATPAEVKVQADQALVDYDASTGADVTTAVTNIENWITRHVISYETTVVAGSTAALVRTGLTQVDGFFDNQLVVIERLSTSERIARNVDRYQQVNGAILLFFNLPFTPVAGDKVMILCRTGSLRDNRTSTLF